MATPDVLLGRYEILNLIGAGGSARVFLAHDRTLDRRVAVKVLDEARARSADPAGHARFLREGRSSARFTHPNAVATFDAGEDEGVLFIVMEYVEGTSLAQRIAEAAPLDDHEVTETGRQLLGALGAAHATGLIHRDVKPANVLLDSAGTVKLADFGIARQFDQITGALTAEGMVIGTREYLAPEQARGLDTGPPTDLYGVGAVLYEMATGLRAPVPAPEATAGADPREVRADISPALAATISTALAGAPEHRFASAEAMAAALTDNSNAPTATMATRATPDALTAPMSTAADAPTVSIPAVAAGAPMAPLPDRPPGWRLGWMLAGLIGIVLAGGIVAASVGGDAAKLPASAVKPMGQPELPASTSTTTAPTTPVVEVTVPPTTTAPAELIAGFPATDDVDQFIAQLREGKPVAGRQSKKLGDGLQEIRREDDGEKRAEQIEKLQEEIEKWVDEEKLDPVVADRTNAFLEELSGGNDD